MRPKTIARTLTTTTKREVVELSGDMIIELLRASLVEVPEGATVQFTTPGGGDWSNTAIDVDSEYPVRVEWQTTTSEEL